MFTESAVSSWQILKSTRDCVMVPLVMIESFLCDIGLFLPLERIGFQAFLVPSFHPPYPRLIDVDAS